ncbi:MAG TPA: M48 family metallopeptidase [Planctomycetaceae bacterium]|nr:M48 family metallopeptidase [Planctomycetaceae bacterium]
MCRGTHTRSCVLAAAVLGGLVLGGPHGELRAQPADARPPFGPPFPRSFADLDAFFERAFGATAEDQQALEAIEVSPEEERELGRQMVEAYVADMKRRRVAVASRGRDVEYLGKLVETLRPLLKNGDRYEAVRVLVLDTPQFEARSFPGGTLVFSRGLLEFAGNEAALVGVVGHELSHLDRGHQLLPICRLKLIRRLAPQGGGRVSPESLLSTGQTLMRLARPFRPEDEQAADRDAAAWMFQAGYDPRELAELFLQMDRTQQSPSFPVPAMFRSHPVNANRHQAALALYEELAAATPPGGRLYKGAENLRRRVPRSEQEFAE